MPTEVITFQGQVQGVGFRPAIWRLANRYQLKGQVINDGLGVTLLLQSDPDRIEQFLAEFISNPPRLAQIHHIDRSERFLSGRFENFSIAASESSSVETTFVTDAATCEECLRELFDPGNRRYLYPFTNCTQCGPRYSIIEKLPYDRCNTSMQQFPLCAACGKEYSDPQDRRFHAQPNACPVCGPKVWLTSQTGSVESDKAIEEAVRLIKKGAIVAVKGIGGYQLLCDATNEQALARLRQRKNRPYKPFALMASDLEMVRDYCHVSESDAETLTSLQAPILLLLQKGKRLPELIAPGLNELGFVLPYSPLHHLLMRHFDTPLVFTSGNASHAPQCIDITQAEQQLADIADYFLHHDRPILNRVDDSVVKRFGDDKLMYRPGRGYAPALWQLPESLLAKQPILAMGSQLKNTFSLAKADRIICSQYIGDLENADCINDYERQLSRLQAILEIDPQIVVLDQHPGYHATQQGRQLAQQSNARLIEVQHHHAHLAACLFDNRHWPEHGNVIAVVLDGLGFGTDQTLWGGEFFIADYVAYQRVGYLKPVPMPGGTAAILQPWRMLFSHVHQCVEHDAIDREFADKPVQAMASIIKQNINSPFTSSCGRLFDAVAAALAICRDSISYEGQAAIELQQLAQRVAGCSDVEDYYVFNRKQYTDHFEIEFDSFWPSLLQDRQVLPAADIALKFHHSLANMIVDSVQQIAEQSGLNRVALCGGVFQNTLLLSLCLDAFAPTGIECLYPKSLPANDSCLSVGQACVAAATLQLE